MIELYWPTTAGEWPAFAVAGITLFFGLLLLLLPRFSLRLVRLRTAADHPDAIAEARGTMAGFYLASAAACLALAQPMLYLVVGLGWAFTALGRLMSILFDRAATRFNWLSFLFEVVMAALPLAYVFGYL